MVEFDDGFVDVGFEVFDGLKSAALHTNITGGAPIMLLSSLISRAIQPSRVSVLAGTIADALLRAHVGEREVAYSNRALPRAAAAPATGRGIAAAATR